MIETVEDAEKVVEEKYADSWPPITTDPKVNFLIDQALSIGPINEDWEEVKEEYESEIEYLSDSEDVEPVDPEEL